MSGDDATQQRRPETPADERTVPDPERVDADGIDADPEAAGAAAPAGGQDDVGPEGRLPRDHTDDRLRDNPA